MYFVNVKSTGVYNNWALGMRVKLFKSSTKRLVKLLETENCEYEFYKLSRLSFGSYFLKICPAMKEKFSKNYWQITKLWYNIITEKHKTNKRKR